MVMKGSIGSEHLWSLWI